MSRANKGRCRYIEKGLMTVNDVIEEVYLAWLNDGSHWVNKDKTGIFCNAANPKEEKLADEIAQKAMKGFNFRGNVVCRRKYNPRHLLALKRVVISSKNPIRHYYVN